MTVIFGPNEAGKSTWHAAAHAALCGLRRGRGQPRLEEREFAALHKPWDGGSWEVSAVVRLADGREIELQQDLEGKVDCRAMDLQMSRDVSNEIMGDGSPDGSVWLGLDRRAFVATACVGQAEILSVMSDPNQLQEHLQRAAATAGTDETAAAALVLLRDYKAEYVGHAWAHSRKPLQMAITRLETAVAAEGIAHNMHEEYLTHAEEVEHLAARALQTGRDLEVVEATLARRQADELNARLSRSTVLHAKYGDSPAPNLAADDALAEEVARAVGAWEGLPLRAQLVGPSAEELRDELDRLPPAPIGDLRPDPNVVAARDAAVTAHGMLAQHVRQQPPQPNPPTTATGEQELRDLARDIEITVPDIDPALNARRREAQVRLQGAGSRRFNWPILALAGLLLVVGIGAGLLVHPVAGVVAAGGAVLAIISFSRPSDRTRLDALQEIVTIDAEGGARMQTAQTLLARKQAAIDRVRSLGLSEDPPALRDLADQVTKARQQEALDASWMQTKTEFETQMGIADRELSDALAAVGVEASQDPVGCAQDYVRECGERASNAELAGRRSALEAQISDRVHLEAMASEAVQTSQAAALALTQAARGCGLADAEPDAHVASLRTWLTERAARRDEHELEVRARTELAGLLDGQSLEELAASAGQKLDRAERLESKLGMADLGSTPVSLATDWEGQLRQLREEHEAATKALNEARGRLEILTQQLPSVAAAEEAVVAGRVERQRVEDLLHTLDTTIRYLEEAQELVHRDIAPILAGTLKAWLPQITGGRYEDATVDPEALQVRVRGEGAPWREARYLSHGTREQIYLLLRMAMVEHLTKPGECAPLLLDDVTVQCDTQRTSALLNLLHVMSRERQIILFSQEDDVHSWAHRLVGPRDSLQVLDALSVLK
jgi:exonuclease SbcC